MPATQPPTHSCFASKPRPELPHPTTPTQRAAAFSDGGRARGLARGQKRGREMGQVVAYGERTVTCAAPTGSSPEDTMMPANQPSVSAAGCGGRRRAAAAAGGGQAGDAAAAVNVKSTWMRPPATSLGAPFPVHPFALGRGTRHPLPQSPGRGFLGEGPRLHGWRRQLGMGGEAVIGNVESGVAKSRRCAPCSQRPPRPFPTNFLQSLGGVPARQAGLAHRAGLCDPVLCTRTYTRPTPRGRAHPYA